MSTKHLTVLATAALAAVLLTGCSTGGSTSGSDAASQGATTGASSSAPTKAAEASGTQSKADACQAFESKVRSAAEGLQSQAAKLQSDPAAAVAKLKELDSSIDDGVAAVTNTEVKGKAEAFQSAYGDMVTRLEAITKDPKSADLSAFQSSATAVQTAGNDFDTTCAS
ncbi:hypothetical protein [Curtobacterium herbarum]|uniref:Small secreted protein n=1 Tax=Curtobacterium herbarum TaxID=150122 RepID=A0ABP4K444_9MICO|nr:hypothetical protein [Curtobacterium herbarum]MBM7474283.1 hypothetical protein [Curtobacterium herbarum]MCS6546104.1 hypothetical protein [Curtobacterium herbarum]